MDLHRLLEDFVNLYKGRRQRGREWYESMGVTVGGSELAAIMGMNPYSTVHDVVAGKVLALTGAGGWSGGEACWWGTLFEDVIGAYVRIDLGSEILGDEICIQEYPGHRNSPDGYIVARMYCDEGGRLQLWTTDMPEDMPTVARVLLLEFKCPVSRRPKGDVPAHYRPQVWSGLAVSPLASMGMFTDAVFRKCRVGDLGDTPEYDTEYHFRDRGAWHLPVAWGLIGVYAPRVDAPRRVRLGWAADEWAPGDRDPDEPDADAATAAREIHAAYYGRGASVDEAADLGELNAKTFNRALALIDRRSFPVRRLDPCFADGRGLDLRGAAVGRAVDRLRAGAPPDHWLMGVIPWKLFEVDYCFVARRPGFMDEVLPLIADVHRRVADALAAPDPIAHLAAVKGAAAVAKFKATVNEDQIQELFDSV